MSAADTDRLLPKFRGAEYEPLWSAVRSRLERSEGRITKVPLKLAVTGEARAAIAGIAGISHAGDAPLSIRLDLLDERIRVPMAFGLIELLELLGGPLANPRAARRRVNAERASAWSAAFEHSALAAHPALLGWLEEVRRSGAATRVAGGVDRLAEMLSSALDVMDTLPTEGEQLATLASRVSGDPHALDRGRPLGALCSSALAWLETGDGGTAEAVAGDADADAGSEQADTADPDLAAIQWRRRWERVGVVCDDLSTSVLVMGLRARRVTNPLEASIARAAEAGLPLRLTLFELMSSPLSLAPGVVSICENPSVVREAILRSATGMPLLCAEGQPNSAFDVMARRCVEAGSELRYHGDFDWGGIRIANAVIARYGARPWRFTSTDYHDAARRLEAGDRLPSVPTGLAAQWDSGLVPVMTAAGLRIYEEQVLDDLMSDLRG